MKKTLVLALMLVFILGLGVVSAKTLVTGKVYNSDLTGTIAGANVTVYCNHSNNVGSLSTLSKSDGTYDVTFYEVTHGNDPVCSLGDKVYAIGTKDGLTGDSRNFGPGGETELWDLNIPSVSLTLGVANVALVPEFTVIAGLVTVLGALGVFFVIRRK